MRARWGRSHDYVSDALAVLAEWSREGKDICRVLRIDDAQHALLTERIKVVADALQMRPQIHRLAGQTEIRVGAPDGALTAGEVTLAARIEEAYRSITGDA